MSPADPYTVALRDQIVAVLRTREIAMTAEEIARELPRVTRLIRRDQMPSWACDHDHARFRQLAPRVLFIACRPDGHVVSEMPKAGVVLHNLARLYQARVIDRHDSQRPGTPSVWTWIPPALVPHRAVEASVAAEFEALVAASGEWP